MIKERFELEDNLENIIIQYNSNKTILKNIKKSIKDHNILGGEVQDIWSKNTSLQEIDEATLYLLTKYIYEFTGEENINPNKYYTETEIKDGDEYIRHLMDEKINFPIILEKVLKGNDSQFITYLSFDYVKKLIDSNMITYNFETQRNAKYKINNEGDLIKVANVKTQSVKEISEFIIDGKFIGNTITLNILQDGNEEFIYKEKTGELIINNGSINIIDGFHRTLGMIRALSENPNINGFFEVRITNWDIQRCKNFIHQENIRNKINPKYLASVINTEKWGNKVVNKLNEGYGDLNGKITTDMSLIRMNRAYTMFDFMSDAIDILWDVKTNMDVNELSEYLSNFFDFVIGYKVEDFIENIEESRRNSIITFPATFIGYLAIAKELQNDKDWKNKLKTFLNNTDFNINNKNWIEIKIINSNLKPIVSLTKSNMRDIINYFKKI